MRVGLIDRNLVGLRIDPEQDLALPDPLIILDGDFNRLPGDPGVDGHLCRANEGVVGRHIRLGSKVHGGADDGHQDRHHQHQWPAQPLPEAPYAQLRHADGCGALDNPIEWRLCRNLSRCGRANSDVSALVEFPAVAYPAGDWRKTKLHGKPSPLSYFVTITINTYNDDAIKGAGPLNFVTIHLNIRRIGSTGIFAIWHEKAAKPE